MGKSCSKMVLSCNSCGCGSCSCAAGPCCGLGCSSVANAVVDPSTNIITTVITTTITENPAETIEAAIGIAASAMIKMYHRKHPLNLKMSHNFAIDPAKLLKLKGVYKGAAALPAVVDLRNKFQTPYDQGTLGSCTANALCGIVSYLDPKMMGSRLFLYYNERKIEGNIGEDGGAYLCDGVRSLEECGICAEQSWEYDVSKFAVEPPAACYKEALDHQVLQSRQLYNDIRTIKEALAEGNPFVVGIILYDSFETDPVTQDGIVPMPNVAREQMLGGHAVCCVGYNDIKKVWIMRNSWGTGWGDDGYFYLPYDYLLDSSLATDLWTLIKIEV